MIFAITGMICKRTNLNFSNRKYEGSSVMVWAGFAVNGTTPIVSIRSRVNSEMYADMLVEHLLPEPPLITGDDSCFNNRMQIAMCLVHHVHSLRPIL